MLQGADIGGYAVVGDVQILEREMSIAGREWTAHDVPIVDAQAVAEARAQPARGRLPEAPEASLVADVARDWPEKVWAATHERAVIDRDGLGAA